MNVWIKLKFGTHWSCQIIQVPYKFSIYRFDDCKVMVLNTAILLQLLVCKNKVNVIVLKRWLYRLSSNFKHIDMDW